MKEKLLNKTTGTCLLLFLILLIVYAFEAILLRMDETYFAENFVNKLLGIVVIFIVLKILDWKWADIGFKRDGLAKGIVIGFSLAAMLFTPYYAIYGDEKKDKLLKKLKCKSDYLEDGFTKMQNTVTCDDIKSLRKTYKQSVGTITGSTKNLVIGMVGTTAVVVATGGLAFTFAPAIATVLVGESAAGLSGASLVSYSLAAIGGWLACCRWTWYGRRNCNYHWRRSIAWRNRRDGSVSGNNAQPALAGRIRTQRVL